MGQLLSAPPDVDLLPPRFERRRDSLSRVPLSPLEYGFGAEDRDALFNSLVAPRNGVSVDLNVRPDAEERVIVSASTAYAKERTDAHLQLGYEARDERRSTLAWRGLARLGTDSTALSAAAFDTGAGVGGYVTAPLESVARQPSDGRAILGRASSSVTLPPPPQRTGGPAAAPELGVRWVAPARNFSTGVHASPFEPYPARLWAVGTYGDRGAVMAGVQCSTEGARWWAGDRGGVGAAPLPLDPSATACERGAPPRLVDVDLAVSLSQAPTFDVSLAVDGARAELVAGYVHHMVVRRAVQNPLAPAHVKGIYNYVDIGAELRRSILPPHTTAAAVGASWQINKNVLVKGRFGTRDVTGSVALKTWWDPAATLSATVAYDIASSQVSTGVRLSLEKGTGAPEYRKAEEGAQQVHKNAALVAQPQLSERTQGKVDREPFAPRRTPAAPTGAASAARAAQLGGRLL